VTLQDEVDKVISFLDRIKDVGDLAVNADPIHAGLPWAGIRLLLEVRKAITYTFCGHIVALVIMSIKPMRFFFSGIGRRRV
jgi:hypothetical protein